MEEALRSDATGLEQAPLTRHWQAGIARQRQGDASGAITLYQHHLAQHPQDVGAWMTLAAALRRCGELDAALVCLQRAVRLRPRDAVVWSALGSLWSALGQCEQALRSHRRALTLDPLRLGPRIAYACSLADACRFEEAQHVIDDCLAREPGRADLRHQRALLCLAQGRYREAWDDYEARWQCNAAKLPALESPRWAGERIGARRVLLLEEQGAAATLWAARYLPMLARRGADLTLAVDRSLHPLLQGLRMRLVEPDDPRLQAEAFDFHCPLMSLPGIVDPRGASIPEPAVFSVADAQRTAARAWLDESGQNTRVDPAAAVGLHVGIAAAEEAEMPGCGINLPHFEPLGMLPGIRLHAIGIGAQAATAGTRGGPVVDLGRRCTHYGEVAATIECMDVVVAPDGVVARLAASLGKPVVCLLPFRPYWIYGARGDSTPWYPAMRLIRQNAPREWGSVFTELRRLLSGWGKARLRAAGRAR